MESCCAGLDAIAKIVTPELIRDSSNVGLVDLLIDMLEPLVDELDSLTDEELLKAADHSKIVARKMYNNGIFMYVEQAFLHIADNGIAIYDDAASETPLYQSLMPSFTLQNMWKTLLQMDTLMAWYCLKSED